MSRNRELDAARGITISCAVGIIGWLVTVTILVLAGVIKL